MSLRVVLTAAYLLAVVAANLTVAAFGPAAVLPVAFVLVGFNMTTRDRLHDAWSGNRLQLKMAALIAVGGMLSYLLNQDAARIALASFVAFSVSESLNAAVYAPLLRRGVPWLWRVNVGNVFNALADSALFITIAFGWMPGLVLAQTVTKIAGGALWSVLLRQRRSAAPPAASRPVG